MLRLCLALALITGCIDDGSDDMPESDGPIWGVSMYSAKIQIGSSTFIGAADAGTSAGEPGMPVRATYTTTIDDKKIVTLTPLGTGSVKVTGVGVGTAHVIAHYGGETQTTTIEVLPRPQPESL